MIYQSIFVHHANQKEKIESEIYHDQNHDQKEKKFEFQQFESRNAMMKTFFNENNKSKYDLAFFICKHCIVFQIFDNSIEFRNHCLKYYIIDIRFSDFKHRQQNENYKRHVREHVYNYSFFFRTITSQCKFQFSIEISFFA